MNLVILEYSLLTALSMLTRYNRNRFVPGLSRGVRALYNNRGRVGGAIGLAAGVRSRQRNARSFTVSRRRKGINSGQGVTDHFDARLIYRKRRMPKFKRRRWKTFVNKVKAASERDLGTQTVVFNKSVNALITTSGQQIMGDFGLYGLSSTDSLWNDLKAIATAYGTAADTGASGLVVQKSSRFLFQSAVLDVTFRNSSTYYNGTANVYASEAKLEVDVYELSVRQEAEDATGVFNNFRGFFDEEVNDTSAIGGAGTQVARTLRGTTPFDFPYALSRFGIKIWKKTKYQLSNNDTFTYQMRDPRRHVTNGDNMTNQAGFNKPGWTRIILYVAKLSPGLTVGTTVGTYQQSMDVGITRKYMFKIENYSEDRSLYVVG